MPLWSVCFLSAAVAAFASYVFNISAVHAFVYWYTFTLVTNVIHFITEVVRFNNNIETSTRLHFATLSERLYSDTESRLRQYIQKSLILATDLLSPIGYVLTRIFINNKIKNLNGSDVNFELLTIARSLVPSEVIHSGVTSAFCVFLLLMGYIQGIPNSRIVSFLFIILYIQLSLRLLSYFTFRTTGQVFRRKDGNPIIRFITVFIFDIISFLSLLLLIWTGGGAIQFTDILVLLATIPSTIPILKDIWSVPDTGQTNSYIIHVWLTLALIAGAFGKYIKDTGSLLRKPDDLEALAFYSGQLGNYRDVRRWSMRMKKQDPIAQKFRAAAEVQAGNMAHAYDAWEKAAWLVNGKNPQIEEEITHTLILLSRFQIKRENWFVLAGYLARQDVSEVVIALCISLYVAQNGLQFVSEAKELEDDLKRLGGFRLPLARLQNISGNLSKSAEYLRDLVPGNAIEELLKLTIYVESLLLRSDKNARQKKMILSRLISSKRRLIDELVFSSDTAMERTLVLGGLIHFEALLKRMGIDETELVTKTIDKSLEEYDVQIDTESLKIMRDNLSRILE